MVDSRENRRTQPQITQTNYIESIEELNKMDIFVCGSCYFVAHFVEEFISHKEMPCERRDVIQPNTSDQKPQVWSFLLWKNAKHRANTQSSSWQLYQEWCTLPDATKNAWIEAGQFLKISSTMKSCYSGVNSKRFISDNVNLDEDELSPMKATIPHNPVANSNKVMKKTRSGKYVEVIVEKILAKRITNKRTEYWVKYKGRSASDEFKHWEPIESMSSTCQDMISSFESKAYLGQDSSGRKRTLSQTGNELNSAGLLNNVVGNKQKMEHVKQWVQDDTSGRIHGDDDVAKKKLRTDGSDIDSTEDYEEFFLRQKGGIILRAAMKSCPKSTHSGGVTKKKNLAAEIGLESEEEEEEGGKENIFGRKNVPAVLKPNEQKNVSPPPPPPSTIPSFSRSSQRVKSKRTQSKSSCVHDPLVILDLKKPLNKKSANPLVKRTLTKTKQKKLFKNVPQSKSLLVDYQSDQLDSDCLPSSEDSNSVYDQVECSLASMIQESPVKKGRTRNQKAKATELEKTANRKSKRKVQNNEPFNNKGNAIKGTNEDVNDKGEKAFHENIKHRKCKITVEDTINKKDKTKTMVKKDINNAKVPLKGEIYINTGNRKDQVHVTDEKNTSDKEDTISSKSNEDNEDNENKVKTMVVQKIKKRSAKVKTINNEIKNNRKGKAKIVNNEKITNENCKTTFKKCKKGKLKEPDNNNIEQQNLVTKENENRSNIVKAIRGNANDQKRRAKTSKNRNCKAIIKPDLPTAINPVDETLSPDANCPYKTGEISNMSPKTGTCLTKKMKLTFKEFLQLSKQNSWHKSIEVLRKKSPSKLSKNLNSTCPNVGTLSDNSYSSGFKKVMLTLEEYNTMNNDACEEIVKSPQFQSSQINQAACLDCSTIQSGSTSKASLNQHIVEMKKDLVKSVPKTRARKRKNGMTKICRLQNSFQDIKNSGSDSNISLRRSVDSVQSRWKLEKYEPNSRSKSTEDGSYPEDSSLIQNNTVSSSGYSGESSSITLLTAASRSQDIIEVDTKGNETCSDNSDGASCAENAKIEAQNSAIINHKEDAANECKGNNEMEPVSSTIVIAKPKRIRAKGTKIKSENSKKTSASRRKEKKVNMDCEDSSRTESVMWPADSELLGEEFLSKLIDSTLADINDETSNPVKAEATLNETSNCIIENESINVNNMLTSCDSLDVPKITNPTNSIVKKKCSTLMKEIPQNANFLSDKNELIFNTSVLTYKNDLNSTSDCKNDVSIDPCRNDDTLVPHCNVSATETFSLNNTQTVNCLSDKNELNFTSVLNKKNDLSLTSDYKNDVSINPCSNYDTLVSHSNVSAIETFSLNNTQNVNFLNDNHQLSFNTPVLKNKNDLSSASDCKNELSIVDTCSNNDTLVPHCNVSAIETFSLNNTESLLSSKEDLNKFVENNTMICEVSVQDQGKLNSEYVNAFCLDFLSDSSVENIMTSTPLQSSSVECMDFIQQNTGTPCSSSAYLSCTPSPSSNPSYHELRGPEPKIPNYDPRNSGLKLPTVRQKFPVINPPGKIKLVKKKVLVVNSQGVVALDPVEIPSLSSGIYIMTNKNEENASGEAAVAAKPAKKPQNETGGYVILNEHERTVKDTNNEALGRVTSHSLGPAAPPKMPNLTAFKSGALTITPSVRNISKDVTANNIIKRQTPISQSQTPQSQSMQKILGPKNTTPKTRQVQYTSRSQPQITYLNSSGETTNKRILGSVNRYKATPDKQQVNHTEVQYTPSQSSKTVIKQEPQSSNLLIPASGYQLDNAGVTDTVMIKVEMSPGGTSQYVRGISGLDSPQYGGVHHQSQVSGLKVKRIESPRKRNSTVRDSAHISILNRKELAGGGNALAVPARKLKMFRSEEEEEEAAAPAPHQPHEDMVTIAGEDGTLYQVASSELNGSAVLLTTGEDGQQQCLYVTDENGQPTILQGATIDGQEMLLDQAVYNEATGTIQMFQDQSGMETQVYQQDENGQLMPVENPDEVLAQVQAAQQQEELLQQQQEQELAALELGHQELTPEQASELLQQGEGAAGALEQGEGMQVAAEVGEQQGDSEVVAQLVEASEPSADGGPRKVVLLLSDGNLIQTEMSEEQFAALENS